MSPKQIRTFLEASEEVKGVCHINAGGEVTQLQVAGATPQIRETWLIPALRAMLKQFSFHSNHSGLAEFRNDAVVRNQIGYGHIAA